MERWSCFASLKDPGVSTLINRTDKPATIGKGKEVKVLENWIVDTIVITNNATG
jgi:hypothetical protein